MLWVSSHGCVTCTGMCVWFCCVLFDVPSVPPQLPSGNQVQAHKFQVALGTVPSSGSSSPTFHGGASFGLFQSLSPGYWRIKTNRFHRSEPLQWLLGSFWDPSAWDVCRICLKNSVAGAGPEASPTAAFCHLYCAAVSCDTPLPSALLPAPARTKILKTNHFHCTVLVHRLGSFMSGAEWHGSLFWKKIDFSIMHIHEAELWLLWQPHHWRSRSVF